MQYEPDPDERPLSPRDRDEAAAESAKIQAEAVGFWSEATASNQRVRITRVITYEGPADWLLAQLGRSLPEGVRCVGPGNTATIRVVSGQPTIVELEIIENTTE